MSLLSRLLCKHMWELKVIATVKAIAYHDYGYEIHTYKCEKCGKFKKVKVE